MKSEKLSSLIDGELETEERAQIYDALHRDAQLRETCETFWIIGDALRGEPMLSQDFSARVMGELKAEPVVLAPKRVLGVRSNFLRGAMQMAAAISGVAVVAWLAINSGVGSKGGPRLDTQSQLVAGKPVAMTASSAPAAPATTAATAATPVLAAQDLPEDDPDRAYMLAHQSYASSAPMPSVAHYIRTVSDEPGVAQ